MQFRELFDSSARLRAEIAQDKYVRYFMEISARERLKVTPGDPDALVVQGDLAAAEGNMRKATAYYNEAVKAGPRHLLALNSYALELMSEHKFTDAHELFLRALELSPDNHRIMMGLGVCRMNNKKITDAINTFEEIISQRPKYAAAYFMLSIVHRNYTSDPRAASRAYNNARYYALHEQDSDSDFEPAARIIIEANGPGPKLLQGPN